MAYVDLDAVHDPVTGVAAPAAWGDQVRDNFRAVRGPARVRVHRGTVQSIPNNVATEVLFDAETIDTHAAHSLVANTGRLTIPPGWGGDWMVGASVKWAVSTAGTFRFAEILVNGAVKVVDSDQDPGASGYASNNFSSLWFPVAGDYLTLRVKQDTGGNLDINPDGYSGIIFWAFFVGNGAG